MSKILYKPYWKENKFLNELGLIHSKWEKGWNLKHYSTENLNFFLKELEHLISNSVPSFNNIVISQLIKNNYLFKQNELLEISDRAIIPISNENKTIILDSVRELKKVRLIVNHKTENDLLSVLSRFENSDFERELVFEITNRFDLLLKKNPSIDIDRDFIKQFYASTNKPLDLIKFVFFSMSRNDILKKDPMFVVLFSYLSDSRLDRLYDFLKK